MSVDISKVLPTNFVLFKIILGDPKHSRLLIHFLNAAIKSESPITSVEILDSEPTPEYVNQKGSRLDIRARTQDNEIVNVEMQCGTEKHMVARSLFYWSKLFSGQLEVSEKYHELKKTVSITILDFRLFQDDKRYWRKGHLVDDETGERMTDLLEMQFIELNKMRQFDEKSPITFWIEFFRDPYSERVRALCDYVPEIQEAKEMFVKAKADPKVREWIYTREKNLRDYINDISCAKDEGKAEGIAEGIAEKARETALKMLSKGMNVEDIAEITGLSVAQIKAL
ncbi:transposase [Alphaproteobacteria bacterium]|nr:transposase [Alphaproteobacteria bacterium]